MKRNIFLIIIGGIFLVIVVVSLYFWSEVTKPVSQQAQVTLVKGEGLQEIAQKLKGVHVIEKPSIFVILFRISGKSIQPGDYPFEAGLSVMQVVDRLSPGQAISREVTLRFIEGWNSKDMASYLQSQRVTVWQDFLSAAAVTDVKKILPTSQYDFLSDKPSGASLEGYLFPDTYRVFRDASGVDIVKKMLDNFDKKFTKEERESIQQQNRTVFDVVTLASIVEKEGKTKEDRRMIADVFLKRIEIGMPLQSDVTVNFATGKATSHPTLDDLQTQSAYNTYQHKGLPPGPICNPGQESMQAVISPAKNEFYYFLTKDDGTAVFSRTNQEHEENKKKYLD